MGINGCVCNALLLCQFNTGDVPLHVHIRETSDAGKPIVVSQPQSNVVSLTG